MRADASHIFGLRQVSTASGCRHSQRRLRLRSMQYIVGGSRPFQTLPYWTLFPCSQFGHSFRGSGPPNSLRTLSTSRPPCNIDANENKSNSSLTSSHPDAPLRTLILLNLHGHVQRRFYLPRTRAPRKAAITCSYVLFPTAPAQLGLLALCSFVLCIVSL